jgi:hypothetical protein
MVLPRVWQQISFNATQHSGLRHISSMDGQGFFHRKKIGGNLLPAYNATEQVALTPATIAKKSHCRKNYCSKLPTLAEMRLVSPTI